MISVDQQEHHKYYKGPPCTRQQTEAAQGTTARDSKRVQYKTEGESITQLPVSSKNVQKPVKECADEGNSSHAL
jgi:hypothetical protein